MEFYVDKHRKSLSAARLPSAAPPATAGRPEARLEKRNLNLRPLASLVPYVKRYRWRAIFTLAALILAAVTTLIVPIAARRMIDFGFSARGVALIDPYFLVMIGVAAALAVASALRYYLVNTLGERIVADLRGDVFAHLTSLSPAFFDEAKTGEHRRYDADKGRSGRFRLGRAAQPRLVRGRHRHDGGDQPSAFNLRAGCDSDHRTAAPCFRPRRAPPLAVCAGYARGCLGLCRRANRCRPRAASLHQREAWHQPLSRRSRACLYSGALIEPRARRPYCILVAASVVVVLWIGAQDVLGARITPGQLGQFVLYAVFAAGALGSLSEVGGEVAQASGAAERLFELLATKPAIVRPAHPIKLPSPARGEVAFEDVHFCYPTRMHSLTLHGVSFRVRQGETVAIVGPSGAGKSTIFHLLLRFYDSNVGRITFDDVPITNLDPTELRARIALVPQDSVMFAASVRDNIRFGRPGACDAAVAHAAKRAHAAPFIATLPLGFDTPIGERGILLSGGQRQRIAIARTILRDAPLLLLDEATSSLDAESETQVAAALAELMQARTTIVIAHRLATVLSCDRILVMDEGCIVEEGTHAALFRSGGLYARLAKLQFEGA